MAGLTAPELEMLEMLEEVLERFRWLQVLCHTQNFLLREKLGIPQEELDQVLEAAARSVDKDSAWSHWQESLGRLRGQVTESMRGIRRERKRAARNPEERGEAG